MADMVYITQLDTGKQIALPLPPEAVKCKAEGKFITYNVINVGEIKLPNGEKLVKFSWSGRLPGASMKHMRMVQEYRSPKEIQGLFSIWRKYGKKLRLLVTGTTINHDVYLESYTVDNSKKDSVEYSVAFIVAKDIIIKTTKELNVSNTTTKTTTATTKERTASKEAAKTSKQKVTYTVKKGDSLWAIAKKYLGNGSRWMEIYNANKSVIDKHKGGPSTIWPGDKLVIPS